MSTRGSMSHPNTALTPRHRLIVVRLVVDDGWRISEVAARFQVSWSTVKRWADRYRAGQSMQDRSSRPHHSPNRTSPKFTRRCIQLRLRSAPAGRFLATFSARLCRGEAGVAALWGRPSPLGDARAAVLPALARSSARCAFLRASSALAAAEARKLAPTSARFILSPL